jgi:DNA repair protein RadC
MSLPSSSVDAVASAALLVRDVDGQYRPARADEVLQQARRVLSQRLRRGATMSSPQAVKDCLRVNIGAPCGAPASLRIQASPMLRMLRAKGPA